MKNPAAKNQRVQAPFSQQKPIPCPDPLDEKVTDLVHTLILKHQLKEPIKNWK
jgi:hypothetical protein